MSVVSLMHPQPTQPPELRGPWLNVATRAAELAHVAGRDPTTHVSEFLADLTSGVEAPHGLFERVCALRVIERAAWEFIHAQIACGLKTHAVGHVEFTEVLTIVETTEWTELTAALGTPRPAHLHPPMAIRIRHYLDAHAPHRMTLTEIARALGVSVSRLTRTFRDQYGIGVHAYLARRRLRDALRLLLTTDVKVSAIAAAVGFSDQSTMFRQFSRTLGVTPRSARTRREQAISLLTRLEGAIPPAEPLTDKH